MSSEKEPATESRFYHPTMPYPISRKKIFPIGEPELENYSSFRKVFSAIEENFLLGTVKLIKLNSLTVVGALVSIGCLIMTIALWINGADLTLTQKLLYGLCSVLLWFTSGFLLLSKRNHLILSYLSSRKHVYSEMLVSSILTEMANKFDNETRTRAETTEMVKDAFYKAVGTVNKEKEKLAEYIEKEFYEEIEDE